MKNSGAVFKMIDGLPSENSRRAYQQHLEEFFYWLQEQNRPELNKALINRYIKTLRARKLSSSTINQKLSTIRKFAATIEKAIATILLWIELSSFQLLL